MLKMKKISPRSLNLTFEQVQNLQRSVQDGFFASDSEALRFILLFHYFKQKSVEIDVSQSNRGNYFIKSVGMSRKATELIASANATLKALNPFHKQSYQSAIIRSILDDFFGKDYVNDKLLIPEVIGNQQIPSLGDQEVRGKFLYELMANGKWKAIGTVQNAV